MLHLKFNPSTYRDYETLKTGVILPEMWDKVRFLAEVLTSKHSQEHICSSHPEELNTIEVGMILNKGLIDLQVSRFCCMNYLREVLRPIIEQELNALNPFKQLA
jgi:hypothetical protein